MMSVGSALGRMLLLTTVLALAIPIALLRLAVVVIRTVSGQSSGPRRDPAADMLRYRFARGEITQDPFEDAMRALGYEKRP
jgi:uncharacterized membrane protein